MRSHFDRACLSLTYALGSQAATWSLGFREEGCVRRTASLSRDFQAAAGLVSADALCYLVLFVGDLHDGGSFLGGGAAAASASSSGWVLVTYVPDSCSSLDAKKATDNKDGLKAGLGAERFCGEMHVHKREQICLSHYSFYSYAERNTCVSWCLEQGG